MTVGRFQRIKLGDGLIGTDLGDGTIQIDVIPTAPTVTTPVFRSQAATVVNDNTSHNITMPAGIASGDFLIMLFFAFKVTAPAVAPSTPSGWTLRASNVHTDTRALSAVYTKPATGSEGSTLTLTTSGSEYSHTGVLAYSGSGGFDAFTDYGSQQTSTTPTVPSVTTTQANDMLVGLVAGLPPGSASGTPASGWTERVDNYSSLVGSILYAMEKTQAAAGASSTAQPTLSGSTACRTYTVAIKGL